MNAEILPPILEFAEPAASDPQSGSYAVGEGFKFPDRFLQKCRELAQARQQGASLQTQLDRVVSNLVFEIDESRNLTFKGWFKDDPSVRNEITLKPQSLSKDKWHLIERAETALNMGGERIRPDERTKINHKRQALIDLCEQYSAAAEGSPEARSTRERIVTTGNELKSLVESVERKYGL